LIVAYLYDSTATVPITPQQLSVNGAPWTGQMAEIFLTEQWNSEVFADASLTPDRPIAPGATLPDSQCFCADVRSSAAAKLFSITSITTIPLIAGDYNRDGKLDRNDYFEWQEAFNHVESHYAYADGNNDGVVDAADYTIWRDVTGVGGTGAAAALSVPEPTTVLLAGLGASFMTGVLRYNAKHRF
jgi:hypothetical protein